MLVDRSNFTVAETDRYFSAHSEDHPVNTVRHSRGFSDVANQVVIRENKDCLYSHAVVDVSKGAVIANPAWDDRYSIIQMIDENQYSFAHLYPGDSLTVTPDMVTTGSHIWLNIRTEVRPENGDGYYDAHQHQDRYVIQAASATPYQSKGFDPESLAAVRLELLKLAPTVNSWDAFGTPDVVSPEAFLIASAGGWAGLPKEHAVYWPKLVPSGVAADLAPSSLTLEKPPLDYKRGGFFSVTTYGPDGFIATEDYAYNHRTAQPNENGSYTFCFNAPGRPNNMTTVAGWNMVIRLYRPTTFPAIMAYLEALERDHVQIQSLSA
ncbi:DUF1254 domain-containing protein [Kribbella capetownensis]|uniref:DUF1254 domain-containing protein n=1 Tax=Kribbella capetownensis TaxID=1572659 RepID=A0A4R0JZ13_9ACTN|nr:DUF1254 domain-containing protein [Kribbella capetownensis]TCC50588.1 DUF1254 domain-containing protein [Kribbella capetownensis]